MHFAPATIADLAALRPFMAKRYWRLMARQVAGTLCWALWNGGERRALCGVDVLPGGTLECFLVLAAGSKPSVSELRFILMSIATHFPDREIVCRIRDGNIAGHRMATLAGFLPTKEFLDRGKTIRTWRRPALDTDG